MQKELKKFQRLLSSDHPETLPVQGQDEEVFDGEDKEQRMSRMEAVRKLTLHFLTTRKREEPVDCQQNSMNTFDETDGEI